MLGEGDARKPGERAEPGPADELILEDELEDPTRTLDDVERDAFERDDEDEIEGESDAEPFEAEAADLVGSAADAIGLDEQDADDLFSIEHDLSRPASPEELRAILGSVFAQHARTIAVAALAALVGGLLLAWCMAPSRPPETPLAPLASPAAQDSSSNPSAGMLPTFDATSGDRVRQAGDASAPVLARMRGPVRATTPDEEGSARENRGAKAADDIQSSDDDEIPDGELIDLRPAGLIPPSESPAAPGDGA
jgi:hypothetical protein